MPNMAPSFAAMLLITLALSQICAEQFGCPSAWLEYGKRCYFFGRKEMWWWKASDNCVSMGGQLTTILDKYEQMWLESKLHGYHAWIGLQRENYRRPWRWTDGSYFAYSNWSRNEPNSKNNNENCVEMFYNGKWNDLPCMVPRGYICKMPLRLLCFTTTTAKPVTCPTPAPCPTTTTAKPVTCPTPAPCPTTTTAKPVTCPTPAPCPTSTTAKPVTCPTPAPYPTATTGKPVTCPTPAPCPTTAKPPTCPIPTPCPTPAKPATCPTPAPYPTTANPATCPTAAPCPTIAKPATSPAGPPPTDRELEMCASSTNETACFSHNVTCSCLLAMVANPKGGFHAVLDGLSVARSIVIKGRSNPQANRLVINLDARNTNDKNGTTVLQLNLDLESQTFTLNARVGRMWGTKQTRDLPQGRPFGAGLPFKIVIKCGSGTFHLDFNDELQLDFAGAQLDIRSINWLEVWQVMLSSIQLM